MVVFVGEGVDQCLELVSCGGLGVLSFQPFFECLVEAFDFAAGGGVVGSRVLLLDVEFGESGFEAVPAAFACGCRNLGREPLTRYFASCGGVRAGPGNVCTWGLCRPSDTREIAGQSAGDAPSLGLVLRLRP